MFELNFDVITDIALAVGVFFIGIPFAYHWIRDKYYPLKLLSEALKIVNDRKKHKLNLTRPNEQMSKFSSKDVRNGDRILYELKKIRAIIKTKKQ